MRLNVLPLRGLDGARQDFDYPLDLSSLELYGECPIPEPVRVAGYALHRADTLLLHMELSFTVKTLCARCLTPLELPTQRTVDRPMADSVADEDDEYADEIILIDNDRVDLDELARECIILEAPMSFLCREDCKGLCPDCGADLNLGPCSCKKDTDPRLAALSELLEKGK